jgi:DNA-binding NarL/FixJ family response regulator
MQLLERIFGIEGQSGIHLNPHLLSSLEQLADQEQQPIETIIEELLYFALDEHNASAEKLAMWQALTPREQETAAFACLGYTNREIAEKMVISTNTVKTHVRNVLGKFNVGRKADLRAVLANWDFSTWLEAQQALAADNHTSTIPDSPERVSQ